MLSPKSSPRGKLLSQYVCVRITRMDGVDLALFDFDRHNTLYFFVLNADEQIYLRYGGRTEESPTSRLDLPSLVLALEKGLEKHRLYQQGRLPAPERGASFYPRQIDGLRENVLLRGRCVECHLIADYAAQDAEADGRIDKVRTMFVSPDIAKIGVDLDVSTGLVVQHASGPAAEAGLQAGDTITALGGTSVSTFGDLQYWYDRHPRDSSEVVLTIDRRSQASDLRIALPLEWWATDLFFRYWTVEPQIYFSSTKLAEQAKRELGLDSEGFACEVRFVEARAAAFGIHDLQPGDILYSVDGVETNPLTTDCELHLKLETTAGGRSELGVLRNGDRITLPLASGRQSFRKVPRP